MVYFIALFSGPYSLVRSVSGFSTYSPPLAKSWELGYTYQIWAIMLRFGLILNAFVYILYSFPDIITFSYRPIPHDASFLLWSVGCDIVVTWWFC